MISVDTSALICLIERIEPARSLFLQHLQESGGTMIVSSFAIAECLAKPIALNRIALVRDYDDLFSSPECRVIPLTAEIARKAAQIRGRAKRKLGDAVHLATASNESASKFLTTDSDFLALAEGLEVPVVLLPRLPD